MRLFRHFTDLDDDARGAVVAVGNFDGVHRGHRAVLTRAKAISQDLGAPLAVATFEPHPRNYFQPDLPPFRLTPLRSKARQLEEAGVDLLFVLTFDAEMAGRCAEGFVDDILVGGLGARHVVVGYDFVFGRKRQGTVDFLIEKGRQRGFAVSVIQAVKEAGGDAYSSTLIRDLLTCGKPADAARVLGRVWEIEGHVLPGDRRGRELGFPTANVDMTGYLLPAFGIYAARAGLDRETGNGTVTDWYDGAVNLGERPTIGDGKVLLEVHIFDFDQDIYGRLIRVGLIEYIRPEKAFDSLDQLKNAIEADCVRVREILA